LRACCVRSLIRTPSGFGAASGHADSTQQRSELLILDAADTLDDARIPPGNRLEKLRGDRAGQHSVRVNQQWRICFRWTAAGPEDLEIVDYH
jgi:plasmid maintenance system killer protein